MEGVNDDIDKRHLENTNQVFIVKVERREQTERRMVKYGQVPVSRPCWSISANVQIPGDKRLSLEMSFMFFQLHPSVITRCQRKGKLRTSWKLHTSTDPGSALALFTTEVFVRSRHRASTTLPFFSLDTFECKL
jgi:hypothetical protein